MSFDLDQCQPPVSANRRGMEPPEEPPPRGAAPPKPSRLDEARRIVEEYAADLREIIRRLRRKMN
jgi:hypothetical protein